MWRKIYRDVVDPEVFLTLADVRRILESMSSDVRERGGDDVASVVGLMVGWSAECFQEFSRLIDASRDANCPDLLMRAMVLQSAPMASALGCWNQGASAPSVFEDAVQLKVLSLLATDIGVGRPRSSRCDEFAALARQHGLPELTARPDELSGTREVRDPMFSLPAALFAVSRRSDALGPEIAGMDLVLRSVGCLPCWSALRMVGATGVNWDRLDLCTATAGGSDTPLETSRWVAEQYAALGADVRRRVGEGAAWVAAALRWWCALLSGECGAILDPERAMADLLRSRSREAAVYHHDFSLAGRELSVWLREAADDPAPLLAALATSKLVRPGESARSPLVNGLLSWRGPMFRVFAAADVATISRWIDSLPRVEVATAAAPPAAGTPAVPPPSWALVPARTGQDEGVEPTSVREAYHLLQGRALPSRTRGFAIRYVRRWLARAELSLDRSDRSLPREWPADGLRPWLLDQHDRHGAQFENSAHTTFPTRAEIIHSTLQLAPLTLIDGAWLEGFTETSLASSKFGFSLFETYWDELGNGQVPLNHPKIYRHVLRGMGIELAPTGSREFAYDSRFDDSSFRRPVYWLCLGKLPLTFLPEILGMNLAMELSGVGGSYRTARRFLKHYGFSTQFVDVHNTIDNVSSGHSAWAADAIDAYLRQLTPESGSHRTDAWRRVRIGYESLDPLPSWRARWFNYRFPPSRRRATKPPAEGAPSFHHMPVELGS